MPKGTPVVPMLERRLSGNIRYRAGVTLGGIVFPEPVSINISTQYKTIVTPNSRPDMEGNDPITQPLGIIGRYINLSFEAGNFCTSAMDYAVGELTEDIPIANPLAALAGSLLSDVCIWTMDLDEFIPQLDELFSTIPPPWSIVDRDNRLARYGITQVTPLDTWQDEQLPGVNLSRITLSLIRQEDRTGSIFKVVEE